MHIRKNTAKQMEYLADNFLNESFPVRISVTIYNLLSSDQTIGIKAFDALIYPLLCFRFIIKCMKIYVNIIFV